MREINDNLAVSKIFVIDDVPENLSTMKRILLEQEYDIQVFSNGKSALEAAEIEPPDLILLDINMPEMDGYQFCEISKANEKLRNIPIIFISALGEVSDLVKAFNVGGVDYVTKPFKTAEIRARIETHLKLRYLQIELEKHVNNLKELVQDQVEEISNAQMATIFALAKLAHTRDDDTGKHLERVQRFCKILVGELSKLPKYKWNINEEYINNVFHASALHDIGKMGIPDSVLLKPARLSPEEFKIMKKHATIGAHMLEEVRDNYPKNSFFNIGIAIARSHHEKWDGTGYPDGLVGEDIPFSARIMAVADVYDALKSKRCYKPALLHEECCEIIKSGCGTQFDPDIIEIFLQIHNQFKEAWEELQD